MDQKEKDDALIDFTPPKEKPDVILQPSNVKGIVDEDALYGKNAPKREDVNWVTREHVRVPGHIAMDPY